MHMMPERPPQGFNSFDSYGAEALNDSSVLALADSMAARRPPPLLTFDSKRHSRSALRSPRVPRFP